MVGKLDRAVLIDDNPEVINAASRMGIGTLLADTPEALSAGVAGLFGIPLRAEGDGRRD